MTQFEEMLRSHKLRVTPRRIAVLTVLANVANPITVDELLGLLKQQSISLDLATVYRIIETLLERKLVKQIDFREGKYRYELAGDHHHHLVCKQCGKITPIYDKCIAVKESVIKNKFSFTVTEHHLEFFGYCSQCSTKTNP